MSVIGTLMLGSAPVLISVEPQPPIIDGIGDKEQVWTVAYKVIVNRQGKVKKCSVQSSSGNAIIDKAGCTSMARTAVFQPATNDLGNPVEGQYSGSVKFSYGKPE